MVVALRALGVDVMVSVVWLSSMTIWRQRRNSFISSPLACKQKKGATVEELMTHAVQQKKEEHDISHAAAEAELSVSLSFSLSQPSVACCWKPVGFPLCQRNPLDILCCIHFFFLEICWFSPCRFAIWSERMKWPQTCRLCFWENLRSC